MKYRKKPVAIEAFKYDGDLKGTDGKYYVPDWAVKAFENGIIHLSENDEFEIRTLEGNMKASIGDYIIRGVYGEIYPCKSDIFESTYELVENEI